MFGLAREFRSRLFRVLGRTNFPEPSSMNVGDVLQVLRKGALDDFDLVAQGAPTEALVGALIEGSENARHQLIYALGERGDSKAVPALLGWLEDRDPGMRGVAADALGKIGDPRTADQVFRRFRIEEDSGVRQNLMLALGSVRCVDAIPNMIEGLRDADGGMRYCAAWSLGVIAAEQARDALERASELEAVPLNRKMMRWAIEEIDKGSA